LVVLAHGYGEHAGRYGPLAGVLTGRGMAVHAMDFVGHGRSAGRRGVVESLQDQVADLSAFIRELRGEAPGLPAGLLGHSVGGAVAAALCAREREIVDALVLSAPHLVYGKAGSPIRRLGVDFLARFLPTVGVERIDPRLLSRIPGEVEAYRRDPLVFHGRIPARTARELLGAAGALESAERIEVPLLIVQGGEDRIAHPNGARELSERVSSRDATFELVAGGYHELLNDLGRDRVSERIADWLQARLLA
jgi:acylglycerol lipase